MVRSGSNIAKVASIPNLIYGNFETTHAKWEVEGL